MPLSPRLRSRLVGLEKSLGHWCAACANRPRIGPMLFLYRGVLQTAHGVPVPESALIPCPACGRGGVEKRLDGVNPSAMLGIHIIENVDPTAI